MSASTHGPVSRRPNPRGQGERLRGDIVAAAVRMLDELGDDETLSLRAVAREVSIAATSIYLHFPDRDSLVLAATHHCHDELVRVGDAAAAAQADPGAALRALLLAQLDWVRAHPGLYKVLHESGVHRRLGMPFKRVIMERTVEAVRRCMDEGLAPPADADTVALDLRTAFHGMLSARVNEPDLTWPPAPAQIDRFLTKLVGLPPPPK